MFLRSLLLVVLIVMPVAGHATWFHEKGFFSFALSANPESMNDEPDPIVPEPLSEDAHHMQINYTWPVDMRYDTSIESHFVKSIQQYFSLRSIKKLHTGPYTDNGTDMMASEVIDAAMFIYGRRYFLFDTNHQGFAYGWYTGIAQAYINGYEWEDVPSPSFVNEESEDAVLPVFALELLYHYDMKNFFVEPSILVGIEDDDENGVVIFPAVILGYSFK